MPFSLQDKERGTRRTAPPRIHPCIPLGILTRGPPSRVNKGDAAWGTTARGTTTNGGGTSPDIGARTPPIPAQDKQGKGREGGI